MKEFNFTAIARYFPALLCSAPYLILGYYWLNPYYSDVLKSVKAVEMAGGITFVGGVIYLQAQICRVLGKELFEKRIFNNHFKMPTTELLLYSNDGYTAEYKDKIRNQIQKDFQLALHNSIEEQAEDTLARKKIIEAVSLIRAKVKQGRLLLQFIIEYNFFRNLVGGSVISLIFSIFNILFFRFKVQNVAALWSSVVLVILYILILTFSKMLLSKLGFLYARTLYSEYLIN